MTGPLARYAEGFREELSGHGYAGLGGHQVHLMAHLSRWLEAQGPDPVALDECLISQFVAACRAGGRAALRSAKALAPLLGYLRGLGVVAVPRLLGPQAPGDRLIGGSRSTSPGGGACLRRASAVIRGWPAVSWPKQESAVRWARRT